MKDARNYAIVLAAAWLCCAGCTAYTQQAPAKPRYEVQRASGAISIDGEIEDSEWKSAALAELIFPWESQTGAKQKTRVRLLWDDENLYAAYECEDSDINAQFTERDAAVSRDDTVELFLNVKPAQNAAYYCLEMNVRGAYLDFVCVDAQYYIRRYNFEGVQIGIKTDGTLNQRDDTDRGWNLEVAVPWLNYRDMSGPPEVGTVFGANLARWDGVAPDRRLSVWSDSKLERPHPHAPAEFGELVFAGDR